MVSSDRDTTLYEICFIFTSKERILQDWNSKVKLAFFGSWKNLKNISEQFCFLAKVVFWVFTFKLNQKAALFFGKTAGIF